MRQGPLFLEIHLAWGVGQEKPLEFASPVEKGKTNSAEAGNSRRSVGALWVAFSWRFTRVSCIGLIGGGHWL